MSTPTASAFLHLQRLEALHTTLRKIEADPEPSPTILELRRIVIDRIAIIEELRRLAITHDAPSKEP